MRIPIAGGVCMFVLHYGRHLQIMCDGPPWLSRPLGAGGILPCGLLQPLRLEESTFGSPYGSLASDSAFPSSFSISGGPGAMPCAWIVLVVVSNKVSCTRRKREKSTLKEALCARSYGRRRVRCLPCYSRPSCQ
jgi:hypothetical protein